MRIRFIKGPDTHHLRHQLLRPLQPIEEMEWYGDNAETTFHLGAGIGDHLVSVASFMAERNDALLGWRQYRIRGMATHPDFQGNGVGRSIVLFGLDHLRGMKVDLAWCNAREKVTGFYAGLGFSTQGEKFMVEGIGMHQLMYVRL